MEEVHFGGIVRRAVGDVKYGIVARIDIFETIATFGRL